MSKKQMNPGKLSRLATASSAAAAQAANVLQMKKAIKKIAKILQLLKILMIQNRLMMTTYLIMNVNSEFGPSNWTYGDFRIGKYESCDIKGDIWAVYQNCWAVYPQEGDIWVVYQHVEKLYPHLAIKHTTKSNITSWDIMREFTTGQQILQKLTVRVTLFHTALVNIE
ncbi:hypothetical protein ACJX0J_041948, partial [Zea mays]